MHKDLFRLLTKVSLKVNQTKAHSVWINKI